MKCPKCNTENSEESLFCNKCGEKLLHNNSEMLNQDNKSEGRSNLLKNKKIIIPSTIILALVIALVLVFSYLNNPMLQFEKNIKNNNYADAMSLYNEEIKGKSDDENETLLFLKDEITEIQNSFKNKKIDYDKAKLRLETIKNTKLVSQEVNTALMDINQLNDSRIAFAKAEEFIKENNYIDGIREYVKVIEEDENYKSAQKQLEKIKENYKTDILKKVEESANSQDYQYAISQLKEASSIITNDSDITAKLAIYEKKFDEKTALERKQKMEEAKTKQLVTVERSSVIAQSNEYKTLYPDMIQVIFRNNSDKTVKEMKVGALAYDNNGYPIKIKIQFAYSDGDYEFVGNAEDVNIVSGARYGEDVGWELDEQHGISTVLSCVKSVTFYDGTTWNNPYYQYWLEEYKEKPLN